MADLGYAAAVLAKMPLTRNNRDFWGDAKNFGRNRWAIVIPKSASLVSFELC
jgi:hypothetical protein